LHDRHLTRRGQHWPWGRNWNKEEEKRDPEESGAFKNNRVDPGKGTDLHKRRTNKKYTTVYKAGGKPRKWEQGGKRVPGTKISSFGKTETLPTIERKKKKKMRGGQTHHPQFREVTDLIPGCKQERARVQRGHRIEGPKKNPLLPGGT